MMGYTYEVNAWHCPNDAPCSWLQIYAGPSMIVAIYSMWQAKRQGLKCIKLEYRP